MTVGGRGVWDSGSAKMASLDMPVIITHTEKLISSDPDLIAAVLFSISFIQDDVQLKMSNDDTPAGKAAILVEAVIKKIEIAPEKFTDFLNIISENAIDIGGGFKVSFLCR